MIHKVTTNSLESSIGCVLEVKWIYDDMHVQYV